MANAVFVWEVKDGDVQVTWAATTARTARHSTNQHMLSALAQNFLPVISLGDFLYLSLHAAAVLAGPGCALHFPFRSHQSRNGPPGLLSINLPPAASYLFFFFFPPLLLPIHAPCSQSSSKFYSVVLNHLRSCKSSMACHISWRRQVCLMPNARPASPGHVHAHAQLGLGRPMQAVIYCHSLPT